MITPEIKITMHQRTALDHVRDTETFNLVSYANNQLALDKPGEYARLIARVTVDRPYIYAGSVEVGEVTSGGFAPSVGAPVAMGWVSLPHAAIGTPLEIEVRGKRIAAVVAPMPFVPHRYRRKA